MLLGMVCFPRSAAADNLGDQLKETQAKAAELKQQLKDAQAKEYDAVYQKNLLDERNNVLLSQIDVLTAQISETETQIEQTQAEEQEQYELFCRQVREEEVGAVQGHQLCRSPEPAGFCQRGHGLRSVRH